MADGFRFSQTTDVAVRQIRVARMIRKRPAAAAGPAPAEAPAAPGVKRIKRRPAAAEVPAAAAAAAAAPEAAALAAPGVFEVVRTLLGSLFASCPVVCELRSGTGIELNLRLLKQLIKFSHYFQAGHRESTMGS